jgi:hypothetical protein
MAREAPNLDGWSAYCADCGIAHPVLRSRARDLRTGEIYHEYNCSKCFMPILTLHCVLITTCHVSLPTDCNRFVTFNRENRTAMPKAIEHAC